MNAYSYKRWSSAKQTDGDSFLRQTELARSICTEKGWNLIDLPPEKGVSAYKGKNLSHKGILGQFIKKVEKGLIHVPCVLIVEKLDRISRKQVNEVVPVFLDLLERNVEVFSVLENTHYSKAHMEKEPALTMIKMVMAFVGAHDYSKAIGQRVKAAKRRKREAALSGKKVWMFDCCPQCFDFDKEKEIYVPNPKAVTIKDIFKRYQKEESLLAVAKQLNTEGTKPFQSAPFWSATTVKDILQSRYVLGEFKGVKNYFPRIIDDATFAEVQGRIQKNAPGRGKQAYLFNLLRGIICCAECGKPASQISNKVGRRYFGCNGKDAAAGCKQKHLIRGDLIEQALFAFVLKASPDDLLKDVDKDTVKVVRRLEAEQTTIEKQIDRLLSLQDIGLDSLRTRLESFKKRQDEITKELALKKSSVHSPRAISNSVTEIARLLAGTEDRALDNAFRQMASKLEDDKFRREIRDPLLTVIQKVVCNFDRGSFHVILGTGLKSDEIYIGD